jgi:hypothetical protein
MKQSLLLAGIIFALVASGHETAAQTSATVLTLDAETKAILRDATADSWFSKEAFTSALLGGLLAVGAAYL